MTEETNAEVLEQVEETQEAEAAAPRTQEDPPPVAKNITLTFVDPDLRREFDTEAEHMELPLTRYLLDVLSGMNREQRIASAIEGRKKKAKRIFRR